MKNMFMVLGTLLTLSLGALAHADSADVAYECKNENVQVKTVIDDTDRGTVYEIEDGVYKKQEGEVIVSRARDAGPIAIDYAPIQAPIDWKTPENKRSCYVMGLATWRLVIKLNNLGDQGSQFTLYPTVINNPNWNKKKPCSPPEFVIQPQALTCSRI